jgi:hypothetical protein
MIKKSIQQQEFAELELKQRNELLEVIDDVKASQNERRLKHLYDTAQAAMKIPPYCNKNIYLVLVKTNSRDENMEPEDRIFVRLSCPTPGYNMDVFKYHCQSQGIEYLFSIPRKHRYWHMWHYKIKYLSNPATKRLMTFILAMESGELLKWVKKECGELPDAIIRTNNEDSKPLIIEA